MTVARGIRPLAILVICLLAVAGVVFGSATASSAAAGEISGQVVDPTLTGLDGLTVIIDDGTVPPAYQTVTTSGGGFFSYSPPADGDYDVVVLGGDDHLDYSTYDWGPISYDSTIPTSGDLGQILLDPGRRITGVVNDAATGLPIAGVVVFAVDSTFSPSAAYYPALPPTGMDGKYSLAVPPGHDYYLVALDGDLFGGSPGVLYDPQFWDHINFSTLIYSCGCVTSPGDPVSVNTVWPGPATTGIDFDLLGYADWIYFTVLAEFEPTFDPYAGLTVLLDKWDPGTSSWDLGVASDVTDADGYADLFGFGAGDYRIRYTVGGAAVAVVSYDDYSGGPYPQYDGGTSVEFRTLYPASPCGCGPSNFQVQELDLLFPAARSGGGGGGTPTPSRKPRSSTFTGFTLPAPTATPTPSPTSTPSPEPTQTSEPSPTPSASADPEPTQNVFDLWWLWLLLLLIVAAIIFFIVRVLLRR